MINLNENTNIRLITSMHLAGLIGFIFIPEFFVSLTAFNLIAGTYLVLKDPIEKKQIDFSSFLLLIVLGFSIEVVGVKTGLLFGEYKYGKAFGIKFLEVPLLIGVNWAMLIFCSLTFIKKFKLHATVSAILIALFLTGLDFFIEQTAMKYDFWYWKNGIIPIQNYLAWFTVSFLLTLLFQAKFNYEHKKLSIVYLLSQVVFFVGLFLNEKLF